MRSGTLVARWLLGTALVSWRYLWQITPLHRSERLGRVPDDMPPPLPAELNDDRLQTADEGVGSFYHRRFRVDILDAVLEPGALMRRVAGEFQRFVPSEVIGVRIGEQVSGPLKAGDELVVEMPGPWDGPVRVVHSADTCLRLATLRGHLEAGQVEFHAARDGDVLTFEVQAWARPSTRLVRWLYSSVRLAKEAQLNMWVRCCRAAAREAGGHPRDGILIETRQLPADVRTQPETW